jgi:hypothetical protein
MGGIRNEIRGPPGGRIRYPITMRRIKLEDPMATRAIINTTGVIVRGYSPSSTNCHCDTVREISRLIKSAGGIFIPLGLKTKLDLFASDPRDGQGGDFVFAEEPDPVCFHGRPRFASLQTAEDK